MDTERRVNKWHVQGYTAVGTTGSGSIVVEQLIRRRELWGSEVRFVNFNVLEELQQGVRRVFSDDKGITNVFKWVSGWLPVLGQGFGVLLHSSVPGNCPTIVTGEVVLVEMS
jgi:hypothetical protein